MSAPAASYRHLWRQTALRLLLTYLAPLVLLAAYFNWQSQNLAREGRQQHLLAIAENQAKTLDLFLRERRVNLANMLEDPRLPEDPSEERTSDCLSRLQRDSDAFVDVGFFDARGSMVSYAGPFPSLREKRYGSERWFVTLRSAEERFVITDMYLGFRQKPHFTMAVLRPDAREPVAVRATLDPKRFGEYLTTLEGAGEVQSVLVSESGAYQAVDVPAVLAGVKQPPVPPRSPSLGTGRVETGNGEYDYAYCWLGMTHWALVSVYAKGPVGSVLANLDVSLLALSLGLILAVLSTILIRASQVVRRQRERDATERELSGQLHHAARLASVGELAAGVAHEINNPLAVIAEEAGLLQDMMDPELGQGVTPDEMHEHLQAIHDAAFRARDITRKLLTFVRKTDVRLEWHDINSILEDAVGGFLEREMTVSNICFVREYGEDLPQVLADRGQLEQVVINLITNAIDAMPGGGQLTLRTRSAGEMVRISVSDTGVGISPEQLERIFIPFHTTKEVGKGTGLGLSVSYGIIKSYGGDILVDSQPGEGSQFTVLVPVQPPDVSRPEASGESRA